MSENRGRKMTSWVKISAGIIAAVVVFALGYFSSNFFDQKSGPQAVGSNKTYLYEIQGSSGNISDLDVSAHKHETFTLTLEGLTGEADVITQFTDRPYREASVLTANELTQQWSALFVTSSPNAVLTYLEPGSSTPQSIVVTLSEPRYGNGSGVLSFHATRVFREDSDDASDTAFIRPVTPTSFVSPSLFIDSSASVTVITAIPGQVLDIAVLPSSWGSMSVNASCGRAPGGGFVSTANPDVNFSLECAWGYNLNGSLNFVFQPDGVSGVTFQGELMDPSGQQVESITKWIPSPTE